jgi:type IV pilus assembly protein PilY1
MEDMRMNIRSKFLTLTTTTLLVLFAGSVPADDTDIFYNTAATVTGAEPIVMFAIDYRPNLGSAGCKVAASCQFLVDLGYLSPVGPYTRFDELRAVLRAVMDPLDGLKVGLWMNHKDANGCENNPSPGCSNGAFIALGAKSFQAGDANGAKAAFHGYLDAMGTPTNDATSHKWQGVEHMFELYRYLSGQGIWNGHVGFNDYASDPNFNMDVDSPATMWDSSVEAGGNYISPLVGATECTKLFSVNLTFSVTQKEADSDDEVGKSVNAGGMLIKRPTYEATIEWMNDTDLADGKHGFAPDIEGNQNLISYFISERINKTTTSYAQAGGTGLPIPLTDDPQDLVDSLTDIFRQILSVSTTFVAASVPVNVFNRAEVVDNLYLAIFQTDVDTKPAWQGNIKKLKVSGLGVNPVIVDVAGSSAIAADGRLNFDALTFWTDPASLPPADPDLSEFDGKDGRSVARGGSGQMIPGFIAGGPGLLNSDAGARQLFYVDGGGLSPLNVDAGTAAALQASLGAIDVAESAALIAYARGLDIDDLDADGDITEAREWIMSDPLHSRPLPLNYGARAGYSDADPAIYIAVSTNDGFIRMLRNTAPATGAESGEEVWAIMPQPVMGKIKTLRANAPGVRHPYLTDGTAVAFLDDANINGTIDPGETAYLFVGMRRGSKNLYAFDISDPENPSLVWTIDKSGDFAELGMTFSTPRVIKVNTGSGIRPALAFGGGYDVNKDSSASDDSEGNAIYVVDAKTGALIWKAVEGTSTGPVSAKVYEHEDLTDSIPSTVSLLDSDGDTLHDRIYVGDTGGNVWRADINGTNTSDWKLSLLASLGRHDSGGKANDRRFFHRPDIVQNFDADGPYDAVLIGSGNRADPLDKLGLAENWFYMIKDRAFKPGSGADTNLDHSDLGDVTNTCQLDDGACTADLENGWALQLTSTGEKSLSTSTTLGGTVYFTTYLPTAAAKSCAPSEGKGRLYAVALTNAYGRNNYDTTTDDEERFEELQSQGIPAEIVTLPPDYILRPDLQVEETSTPTRIQTYWFESEDSDL